MAYEEEYSIATTLLADLFWGARENRQSIQEQLSRLNVSIAKKNKKRGLRLEVGQIDVPYFSTIAEGLDVCCRVANSHGNTSLFHTRQHNVRQKISQSKYPEEWNLDENDFLEFTQAVERGKIRLDGAVEGSSAEESNTEESNTEGSNYDATSELGNKHDVSSEIFHETFSDRFDPENGGENEAEAVVSPSNGSQMLDNMFVSLKEFEQEAEKEFGIPFQEGIIQAWQQQSDKSVSVVVLYEHVGKAIARLEPVGQREFDPKRVPNITECSRIKKRGFLWDRSKIEGYGLVAWKVDDEYKLDPTAILQPMENGYYPETYISIFWDDKRWTWESRESFRHLIRGNLKADALLYKRAITSEAHYQEALSGAIPIYPLSLNMDNVYWKNVRTMSKGHTSQSRDSGNPKDSAHFAGEEENAEKHDSTPQISLQVLTGLEVSHDGLIFDEFDELVGHVVEGDVDALMGYTVSKGGEILDEDGDLVGRAVAIAMKGDMAQSESRLYTRSSDRKGRKGHKTKKGKRQMA